MTTNDKLADALRSIAEGNLGDASWQANYERIRAVAREALAAPPAQGEWVMVPRVLPFAVLGEAGMAGVFETGNPKHGWDFLLSKVGKSPQPLTDDYIEQHIGPDEDDREAVAAVVREVERAHGIAAAPQPAPGEAELLQMVATNIRSNLGSLPSIASDWADKIDTAIVAMAQQKVPDAVRLCAKPQQWTEDGVARASGWREWREGLMEYHISFDPQEEPDNRYTAACGEGEPESFATLEEAQQWCQSDADDWIRKIAMIDQQQEARGNGE